MRGAERRRHEEHSPWQQLGRKERGRSGWDSRYTDPFVRTKNNFGPYWVSGTGDVGGNKAKSLASALTFRWRRQKRNS